MQTLDDGARPTVGVGCRKEQLRARNAARGRNRVDEGGIDADDIGGDDCQPAVAAAWHKSSDLELIERSGR